MEWKTTYRNKIVSADEAVRRIRDNEWVSLGHAAGVPQQCVDALIRNYKWFKNVSIYHMLVLGEAKYTEPGMEEAFRHVAGFIGANTRQAIRENRVDFLPAFSLGGAPDDA